MIKVYCETARIYCFKGQRSLKHLFFYGNRFGEPRVSFNKLYFLWKSIHFKPKFKFICKSWAKLSLILDCFVYYFLYFLYCVFFLCKFSGLSIFSSEDQFLDLFIGYIFNILFTNFIFLNLSSWFSSSLFCFHDFFLTHILYSFLILYCLKWISLSTFLSITLVIALGSDKIVFSLSEFPRNSLTSFFIF